MKSPYAFALIPFAILAASADAATCNPKIPPVQYVSRELGRDGSLPGARVGFFDRITDTSIVKWMVVFTGNDSEKYATIVDIDTEKCEGLRSSPYLRFQPIDTPTPSSTSSYSSSEECDAAKVAAQYIVDGAGDWPVSEMEYTLFDEFPEEGRKEVLVTYTWMNHRLGMIVRVDTRT